MIKHHLLSVWIMQVSLIFKCPDLFIPVMYTDSDMSIAVVCMQIQ